MERILVEGPGRNCLLQLLIEHVQRLVNAAASAAAYRLPHSLQHFAWVMPLQNALQHHAYTPQTESHST